MSDTTSRPYRPNPEMACERCVFGRGEHAEFCPKDAPYVGTPRPPWMDGISLDGKPLRIGAHATLTFDTAPAADEDIGITVTLDYVPQTDQELAEMARAEPGTGPAWIQPEPPTPYEDISVEGLSTSRVDKPWRTEDHVELMARLEIERDERWMDE